MVDVEFEEWHAHQVYLSEGPRAAEVIYKSVRNAKEQDARKWDLQKDKGWKIIIDHLSLDVERDLQRVQLFEERMRMRNVRWLWFEVRKIGTGQGVRRLQGVKERFEDEAYSRNLGANG